MLSSVLKLLGADKTGRKRFYEEMIARAEALWEEYLHGHADALKALLRDMGYRDTAGTWRHGLRR